jgi:hypothetical protein
MPKAKFASCRFIVTGLTFLFEAFFQKLRVTRKSFSLRIILVEPARTWKGLSKLLRKPKQPQKVEVRKVCELTKSIFVSLYKFACVSFEFLLAIQTTEIIGLSVVSNLKFGCVLIKNRTANRVSRHSFLSHLTQA